MTLTPKSLGMTAAAGSAALLLGAFVFQALGYAPCAMCIWQRYPHAIAIGMGAMLLFALPILPILIIGALSVLSTSALGVFHTGVERGWWEGPTSCTGSGLDVSQMSVSELLPSASSNASNLVLCSEVVWEFLTLSMASWNAILSGVLACLWLVAIARHQKVRWHGVADVS